MPSNQQRACLLASSQDWKTLQALALSDVVRREYQLIDSDNTLCSLEKMLVLNGKDDYQTFGQREC